MNLIIHIEPGGRAWTLGDMPDGLCIGGDVTVTRASHILPVHPIKRLAFKTLRSLFGERGRVAAYTRSWVGPWESIIINTNKRFSHPSRRVCLDWERRQIEEY